MKAVDDATKRQRLLMQRQETERRIMGREEERMRRCQELTRRVVEKPHRDFQEKGHRLYHHAIAHSTYAPGMCACGCCSCSCWFVCCFSLTDSLGGCLVASSFKWGAILHSLPPRLAD